MKLADAYNLFHEGTIALAEIEANGLCVDTEYLEKSIRRLTRRIEKHEALLYEDRVWTKWKKIHGDKAKLGSRAQLDKVLDALGYQRQGRTASGRGSTAAKDLENIDLPFVKQLLKLDQWKKILSTNFVGLRRETVDGIVHPFFNLAGGGGGGEDEGGSVRSYRGSSAAINLQNQPSRDPELTKWVRRCFIPRPGWQFIEADFGALEFRIIAAVYGDPNMMSYASDPSKDIHRDYAAKLFKINKEQAKQKDLRYIGKNGFVFPYCYGSYYKKIAQAVWVASADKKVGDIPVHEWLRSKGIRELGACAKGVDPQPGTYEYYVKEVQNGFDRDFPTFKAKADEWEATYKQCGYFEFVTGFRCEGVYSRNQLRNYRIQGPGFHCLLWCLTRLQKWLRKNKMRCLIVGQIHDCILLDCPPDELQSVLTKVKKLMTEEIREHWSWITVPLLVEVDCTEPDGSWLTKHSWIDKDGVWVPKEAA